MDDAAEAGNIAGIIRGIIIIGGDALALSTARELSLASRHRVMVLWPADPEFAGDVETAGATYVAARPESQDGLVRAGVHQAAVILALSRDDQLNLQAALRARRKPSHSHRIAPVQPRARDQD